MCACSLMNPATQYACAVLYCHLRAVRFYRKGKALPKTGHEGPEGEQMYSYNFSSTSTLDMWVGGWSTPRTGRFTPRETPGTHCIEAGWAPGPVWTGVENMAFTGIRSPDRPASSKSLHLLSYPGRPDLPFFSKFISYTA